MARKSPPDVADILARVHTGQTQDLRRYEITMPGGVTLRADGAEDHARALESIGRLSEVLRTMPAPPPVAPVKPTPPLKPIPLGDAARKYRLTLDTGAVPKKTITQKMSAIEGFTKWKGVKVSFPDVTRTDVAEWFQSLRLAGLSTPTLTNKSSYLTAFFEWGKASGYCHFSRDDNPATKHVTFSAREKRQRRRLGFRAFTAAELQRIYAPAALEGLNEQTRWGAILGLYFGARVSEVGQLSLSDFVEIEGVWCVRITDEGEGQSLKNDASRRQIPVHPDLIRLGLLDRLARLRAAGRTQMFPRAKIDSVNGRGNWLSASFGRHLRALGIRDATQKVGFHSLRKTAIQQLQAAGVVAELRCQYAGHEIDDEHRQVYSRRFTMAELRDGLGTDPFRTPGISAMTYGLDLAAIARVL